MTVFRMHVHDLPYQNPYHHEEHNVHIFHYIATQDFSEKQHDYVLQISAKVDDALASQISSDCTNIIHSSSPSFHSS